MNIKLEPGKIRSAGRKGGRAGPPPCATPNLASDPTRHPPPKSCPPSFVQGERKHRGPYTIRLLIVRAVMQSSRNDPQPNFATSNKARVISGHCDITNAATPPGVWRRRLHCHEKHTGGKPSSKRCSQKTAWTNSSLEPHVWQQFLDRVSVLLPKI